MVEQQTFWCLNSKPPLIVTSCQITIFWNWFTYFWFDQKKFIHFGTIGEAENYNKRRLRGEEVPVEELVPWRWFTGGFVIPRFFGGLEVLEDAYRYIYIYIFIYVYIYSRTLRMEQDPFFCLPTFSCCSIGQIATAFGGYFPMRYLKIQIGWPSTISSWSFQQLSENLEPFVGHGFAPLGSWITFGPSASPRMHWSPRAKKRGLPKAGKRTDLWDGAFLLQTSSKKSKAPFDPLVKPFLNMLMIPFSEIDPHYFIPDLESSSLQRLIQNVVYPTINSNVRNSV